jgi:hypothetical protein
MHALTPSLLCCCGTCACRMESRHAALLGRRYGILDMSWLIRREIDMPPAWKAVVNTAISTPAPVMTSLTESKFEALYADTYKGTKR